MLKTKNNERVLPLKVRFETFSGRLAGSGVNLSPPLSQIGQNI